MELLHPTYWVEYLRRNRARVLMYHSISVAFGDRLAISPELFTAQMDYLASHGYRVISLADACAALCGGADLRKVIVLTFDDGYRDFLTEAAPILCRCQFPATIFPILERTRNGPYLTMSKGRPTLSPAEVSEIRAMGFQTGSHTMTHPDLTDLDSEALTKELSESYRVIAQWGETFIPFAYPGGRFNRSVRDAAERSGYDCGVIVGGRWGNGPETDRFLLKREPMLASDTLRQFAWRVGGYYELYYLLARARGIQTR